MATECSWAPAQVFGVLSSQIGYDPAGPVRVLIRSHDPGRLRPDAACWFEDPAGGVVQRGRLEEEGRCWGSSWWSVAMDAPVEPGTYRLGLCTADGLPHRGDLFDVEPGVLFDATFEKVALDQLERRARFAKAKKGWMDAGMPWQECNAHGSMVIGLLDVLEVLPERLSAAQRDRLHAQVVEGCDYLAMLQDEAASRGLAAGALSHMIPDFEDVTLPADASKAAVAWAMAARLLPAGAGLDREDARRRAAMALRYAASEEAHRASAAADPGFKNSQRGLEDSYAPPPGQPMTRELWTMAWAEIELAQAGDGGAWERAVGLVGRAIDRQADESEAMHGLHGFFFEFDDRHHAEPAWAHQITGSPMGMDAGATFPHWVLPVVLLLRHRPGDAAVSRWRSSLERFVRGYLLPACGRNPFGLLPNLLHREEGLIHFAGPWHGMSCIYTLTAGLALELHREVGDDALVELATANLQWVAGLNAGLTREALRGCHMFTADVPEGVAWPVSMIHGVGRRTAGSWCNIRGSVGGGFAVGEAFEFDVRAEAASDGPHQFYDEEWLPFAAGWLSGVCRWERHAASLQSAEPADADR